MTPLRILLFGLLATAVLLAVLNPGEAQFREFLQQRIAAEAAERADAATGGRLGDRVTGFLADRLGRAAGEVLAHGFERDNYYVASVYRADLNGWREGGEVEFLGIAGKFFPLTAPDEIRALLE